MREIEIEQPACNYAKRRGWWCCKFVAPGLAGVPDRIFIRKGLVMFIEFKRPGEEVTTQQKLRHKEMRKQGVMVHECDNLETAYELLR